MEWLLYLIPIVAILGWGVSRVIRAAKGADFAASRAQLYAINQRLDAIDTRLAAVERTLNEIP